MDLKIVDEPAQIRVGPRFARRCRGLALSEPGEVPGQFSIALTIVAHKTA
jgi:hypothetical protein